MGNLYHSIFIQQGSSQTYRVANESRWMVLDEVWQGNRIVNTTCRASFPGTPEGKEAANTEANRIHKAKDW